MSTINLVSALMNHGKSLAKQLDQAKIMFEQKNKAKTIPKPAENNIYDEVEKVVNGLMKDLGELDDGEYTTKECFDKVVRRTISSLEELKKHDDPQYATGYEALITKAGKFRRLSTDASSTHGTSTPIHNNNNENDDEDNNNHAQDTLTNFMDSSRKILYHPQIALLVLFAMLPRGTNIKKNDLLLWWSGTPYYDLDATNLDPINFDGEESDFEQHLRELTEVKLIEPVASSVETVRKNNKREGVKYKMPNVFWSKFQLSEENIEIDELIIRKKNSLSLSRARAVNTNACNLTAERLNTLSKRVYYMLQLGNWNHDPTKYIVIEDVDSLNKVLHFNPLFFLSLEGVSGLVQLHGFEDPNLRVLNLKGCHNLESIPQTFHMIDLQYLDMSDCYQLDHPNNVLDNCISLRVVKGYVLPHRQPQPEPEPGPLTSFISNPSQFTLLWKLTLRTRRLNFPRNSDLETLCELQSLTHLKITWVGACSDGDNHEVQIRDGGRLRQHINKDTRSNCSTEEEK